MSESLLRESKFYHNKLINKKFTNSWAVSAVMSLKSDAHFRSICRDSWSVKLLEILLRELTWKRNQLGETDAQGVVLTCIERFKRSLTGSRVLTGSLSRGGDVAVYVFDINQPTLPTPFYSVLVSISVFMALSTVFYSINSPDNSPLPHSVLPVLFLPYWSFQLLYLFMKILHQTWNNPLGLTGLKASAN